MFADNSTFLFVCFREDKKGIADIFVKKGPFLKLFSSYIRDFETITATYDDALKKYPLFQAATKEFEVKYTVIYILLARLFRRKSQAIVIARLSSSSDKNFNVAHYSKSIKDINTNICSS